MTEQAPPKAFFDKLPHRTEQELLGILAAPEEYLPMALKAAEGELKKRGVSHKVPAMLRAEKAALSLSEERAKSLPLSWVFCILIFVVGACWGMSPVMASILVIISTLLAWKKQMRRVRGLWLFYVFGAVVWVVCHVGIPLLK